MFPCHRANAGNFPKLQGSISATVPRQPSFSSTVADSARTGPADLQCDMRRERSSFEGVLCGLTQLSALGADFECSTVLVNSQCPSWLGRSRGFARTTTGLQNELPPTTMCVLAYIRILHNIPIIHIPGWFTSLIGIRPPLYTLKKPPEIQSRETLKSI